MSRNGRVLAGDGVLPVDKPEGPTSHDVVAAARRALGTRRVGHTGTLDPFASGLLLLCVGRATRLAEYLTGLPKSYDAVATLGVATDTDDRDGTVTAVSDVWRALDRRRVEAAFTDQIGQREQVPPAFSAKKVAGERLYRRARRGEAVAPEPVAVEIHTLQVTRYDPPDVAFHVTCSSGTYIRAIARDAGAGLGCGAHLSALRRTAIGRHGVGAALPMAELGNPAAVADARLSPLQALAHLPVHEIDADGAARLAHGRPVPATALAGAGGLVAVAANGDLVAIARAEGGCLYPRKVFARDR